jgi:hypothetical protein
MGVTDEGSGSDGDADGGSLTPPEQALLEAALEFYGAAEGVIELGDRERPQLRHDVAGFEAIRRAMGALEQRVAAAHAAGVSPERIAQIARMEQETIDLILQRQSAAPKPDRS